MRWPFVRRSTFDNVASERDGYRRLVTESTDFLRDLNARNAERNARFAGQVAIADSKAMSVVANCSTADSKAASVAAQVASWDALSSATD